MTITRTRVHHADATGEQWRCSCGKNAGNTHGTIEAHHATAAKREFARLLDVEAGAVISMGADRSSGVLVLRWLPSGDLRPYALPYYDWAGSLRAPLDWPAIVTALDAGELPGDERRQPLTLRIAASLNGHGAVALDQIDQLDRDLRIQVLREFARALMLRAWVGRPDDEDEE